MQREISQSQKDKCCMIPLYEILRVVKIIDRKQDDSSQEPREKNRQLSCGEYRVLEMDGGDGCITA